MQPTTKHIAKVNILSGKGTDIRKFGAAGRQPMTSVAKLVIETEEQNEGYGIERNLHIAGPDGQKLLDIRLMPDGRLLVDVARPLARSKQKDVAIQDRMVGWVRVITPAREGVVTTKRTKFAKAVN